MISRCDLSDPATTIGGMANYTYRAEWSPDQGAYLGTCLEFPRESSRAPTAHAAIERIEQIVADVVAELVSDGGTPPPSLTDRHYSGNFLVRTSPQLHSRLVVDASEQGVSLNQWVVQKLAGRSTASLDPWF